MVQSGGSEGMELNDLLVFTRVVEAGGFTAAAKVLGLPKSTVSRRIARLEDHLGVRLLQRTTRSSSLTETGRAFYERCARIVADAEAAEQSVRDMGAEPRGRLRITAPVEAAIGGWLSDVVERFLASHPHVEIDLDLTNRYVDLVSEGYDLAVRAGPLSESTLIARKLRDSPRYLVASPDYLQRRGEPTTLDDLAAHECIVSSSSEGGPAFRLLGPEGPVQVPVRARLACNNFQFVLHAAISGLGIAQVPRMLCFEAIRDGALRRILPQASSSSGSLYAVYPSTRHLAPAVRAFLDLLADSPLGPDDPLEARSSVSAAR